MMKKNIKPVMKLGSPYRIRDYAIRQKEHQACNELGKPFYRNKDYALWQ